MADTEESEASLSGWFKEAYGEELTPRESALLEAYMSLPGAWADPENPSVQDVLNRLGLEDSEQKVEWRRAPGDWDIRNGHTWLSYANKDNDSTKNPNVVAWVNGQPLHKDPNFREFFKENHPWGSNGWKFLDEIDNTTRGRNPPFLAAALQVLPFAESWLQGGGGSGFKANGNTRFNITSATTSPTGTELREALEMSSPELYGHIMVDPDDPASKVIVLEDGSFQRTSDAIFGNPDVGYGYIGYQYYPQPSGFAPGYSASTGEFMRLDATPEDLIGMSLVTLEVEEDGVTKESLTDFEGGRWTQEHLLKRYEPAEGSSKTISAFRTNGSAEPIIDEEGKVKRTRPTAGISIESFVPHGWIGVNETADGEEFIAYRQEPDAAGQPHTEHVDLNKNDKLSAVGSKEDGWSLQWDGDYIGMSENTLGKELLNKIHADNNGYVVNHEGNWAFNAGGGWFMDVEGGLGWYYKSDETGWVFNTDGKGKGVEDGNWMFYGGEKDGHHAYYADGSDDWVWNSPDRGWLKQDGSEVTLAETKITEKPALTHQEILDLVLSGNFSARNDEWEMSGHDPARAAASEEFWRKQREAEEDDGEHWASKLGLSAPADDDGFTQTTSETNPLQHILNLERKAPTPEEAEAAGWQKHPLLGDVNYIEKEGKTWLYAPGVGGGRWMYSGDEGTERDGWLFDQATKRWMYPAQHPDGEVFFKVEDRPGTGEGAWVHMDQLSKPPAEWEYQEVENFDQTGGWNPTLLNYADDAGNVYKGVYAKDAAMQRAQTFARNHPNEKWDRGLLSNAWNKIFGEKSNPFIFLHDFYGGNRHLDAYKAYDDAWNSQAQLEARKMRASSLVGGLTARGAPLINPLGTPLEQAQAYLQRPFIKDAEGNIIENPDYDPDVSMYFMDGDEEQAWSPSWALPFDWKEQEHGIRKHMKGLADKQLGLYTDKIPATIKDENGVEVANPDAGPNGIYAGMTHVEKQRAMNLQRAKDMNLMNDDPSKSIYGKALGDSVNYLFGDENTEGSFKNLNKNYLDARKYYGDQISELEDLSLADKMNRSSALIEALADTSGPADARKRAAERVGRAKFFGGVAPKSDFYAQNTPQPAPERYRSVLNPITGETEQVDLFGEDTWNEMEAKRLANTGFTNDLPTAAPNLTQFETNADGESVARYGGDREATTLSDFTGGLMGDKNSFVGEKLEEIKRKRLAKTGMPDNNRYLQTGTWKTGQYKAPTAYTIDGKASG